MPDSVLVEASKRLHEKLHLKVLGCARPAGLKGPAASQPDRPSLWHGSQREPVSQMKRKRQRKLSESVVLLLSESTGLSALYV